MTTLDEVLDRLLHERSYRHTFFGVPTDCSVPDDTRMTFAHGIDSAAVMRLAARMARDTLARRHAGGGSLLELYPECIESWQKRHPQYSDLLELAYCFMDSPAFRLYRELPFCGVGLSLEECFFRFAEVEGLAEPAVREHEFLAAMLKLLVASPTAQFHLPSIIRTAAHGFFAISTRGAPTLFAALKGRYVYGPLSPFLVELLDLNVNATKVAARHGVPELVLHRSLEKFSQLGLGPVSGNEST